MTCLEWIVQLCVVLQAARASEGFLGGGSTAPARDCLSADERAEIGRLIAEYRAHRPESAGVPEKFTFYPMGGRLDRDLFTNNYVDLDPSSGLLDWDCTAVTYDGHDATDVDLRSFAEQTIGVPVFAALDGVVVATHDGENDMNTSCTGPANYVIIDHGAGRICYYLHLRKNSVQVVPTQPVAAGEQIGFAASSGCSTGPHLHFATYDDGNLVEPYTGACNPGESQWVDQPPLERALILRDLNITDVNIPSYPGLPFDMPRRGTYVQGSRPVRLWISALNMPASCSWQVRYLRPDGSSAEAHGGNLGNPAYRVSWWWWAYTVDLEMLGTWTLRLTLNGAVAAEVPFDVVATAGEVVNRPPERITVSLWPEHPRAIDVLQCRVGTDLLLDDRDYDVVRYHYVWSVNDVVVRDLVSAGHSDALARGIAQAGDWVTCEVTPSDGTANAPSAVAGEYIRPTRVRQAVFDGTAAAESP